MNYYVGTITSSPRITVLYREESARLIFTFFTNFFPEYSFIINHELLAVVHLP